MIRLLIVIVCYTLAVFLLPRWAPFAIFLQDLARLPAHTSLVVNISALISAGACLYIMLRQSGGLSYRRPSGLLDILRAGLIGVIFASLYDLFEALSGFAVTVVNLALIPPAFMAGEAAYVFSLWGWRKLSGQQARRPVKLAQLENTEPDAASRGLPRLLITMPVYIFVLVYLPQQQDFRNLESKLVNISASVSFAVSVAALIGATSLGLFYLSRVEKTLPQPTGDPVTDTKALHFTRIRSGLIVTFSIGLGIAALINILGYFVNYAPSLSLLILMPLAFTIAEVLFEGLNWRVTYGPG